MITEGRKYLIGIDASLDNAGCCIYDPETNRMQLFTGTVFGMVAFVNKNANLSECVAVVENINMNSPLFRASGILRMELGKYKRGEIGEGSVMATFGRLSTMAQGLGKSKAACDLIISMFRQRNVPVVEIAPSDRHRADKPPKSGKAPLSMQMLSMPTKTTRYQFETITGFTGVSSEHSRDASTLVWGKSMQWAETMILRQLEKKAEEIRDRKLKTTSGDEVTVKNGKFEILNTVKKR